MAWNWNSNVRVLARLLSVKTRAYGFAEIDELIIIGTMFCCIGQIDGHQNVGTSKDKKIIGRKPVIDNTRACDDK